MTDTHTPEQRSRNMAAIRCKDTSPERLVRSELHRRGFRFSLHRKDLPGKPDIVLPKYRTVIFVHGCFWHRHSGCRYCSTPSSNTEYWVKKFKRNVKRDRHVCYKLRADGWRVILIWECQVRNNTALQSRITTVARQIHRNAG